MDARNVSANASLIQVASAVALGALLLYGGMALERAGWGLAEALATVFVTLVGVVAAVWALARLDVTPLARWVVLGLLGVAPVAAFLGWVATGAADGLMLGILVVNLLAGATVIGLIAWRILAGGAKSGRRTRTPRVE